MSYTVLRRVVKMCRADRMSSQAAASFEEGNTRTRFLRYEKSVNNGGDYVEV